MAWQIKGLVRRFKDIFIQRTNRLPRWWWSDLWIYLHYCSYVTAVFWHTLTISNDIACWYIILMMTSSKETFSALLALCVGNSRATGEFPSQKTVTRSFDASFDLRLNKRLSKQSWGWWFETPSHSLWRHCNVSKGWSATGRQNVLRPISRFPAPSGCVGRRVNIQSDFVPMAYYPRQICTKVLLPK